MQTFMDILPPMDMVSEKARELGEIIQGQGSETGVMVFKPKRISDIGMWRYAASITIKNRYENIKKTLAAIQNSSSLFCIEHLSIKKEGPAGQVEMKLVIATYCR